MRHRSAARFRAREYYALPMAGFYRNRGHGFKNGFEKLINCYDIAPVAIESLGAIGPLSRALLKDLGRRIKESTGEARAHEYLVQRLAVAVQRGNAVSIMGTMGDPGQDFFG